MARLRRKDPWAKVEHAELLFGGQSAIKPSMPLGNVWELRLACGHITYRPAKYKPLPPGSKRPGWWKRRSPEDALPAFKRVRCSACGAKSQ